MARKRNLGEALAHYKELRREAHEMVEREHVLRFPEGLRLTDITRDAIREAMGWRYLYEEGRLIHRPSWDWEKTVRRFHSRARVVEAALWYQNKLHGIAIGRVSRGHLVASLHYLESLPTDHDLKGAVAAIMTRFLEIMGVAIGCSYASLEYPVESLVDFYSDNLGFSKKIEKHNRVLRLQKQL